MFFNSIIVFYQIDIEVDDSWTDDVSKGRAKLLDGLPNKSRPYGKGEKL